MKELDNYSHYLAQMGVCLKKGFTTATGWLTMMTSFIIALNSVQRAILALIVVYLCDIVTGCFASWVEHRKSNEKIQVYFFESRKIRLSIVKGVFYMLFIICAWILNCLFFDLPMGIPGSSKQFTVVELTTGVCIAIEIFSNVENSKRAGFDILAKLKALIKQVWNLKNLLKNGKETEA